MIDVCFLLLFFYMLTSKPVKPEADMIMTLSGTVLQEENLEIPDEQRITIHEDDDLPMDNPRGRDLPALLARFKETAGANRSEALVTVDAADGSHHQRIVDVLNVCAQAGIHGVTLATSEEDSWTSQSSSTRLTVFS